MSDSDTMSDDDAIIAMPDGDGDEKYTQLMGRIAELEEECKILRMNQAIEGQGGMRQVPFSIAVDVKKYISRSKIENLQKLIQEKTISANDTLLLHEGEFFLEDLLDEPKTMSLLEYAAFNGQYEVCSLLLNLGAEPGDDEVDEMVDNVADKGYIHIAVLLASSVIHGAGGSEVKDIILRLDRQNGIMKTLLNSLSENENIKQFIDIMESNIIKNIEEEVGFSDDFLNLLYHYYTKIEKKPFIETNLFAAINKKCAEIINNKNMKNWYFFKTYIMSSTIWMRSAKNTGWEDIFGDDEENEEEQEEEEENKENGDDEKILFYELLKIVNNGFEDKINKKLREPFKQIAEDNADDWKALCSYDIESTLESKCRQDLVPNGVKPDYTHNELTQYVPSSTSFNAYQHYDVNEYLSKLLLTAHTVDKEFHESIQEIFKIDLQTNFSKIETLNNMEYQKGPVKLITRCKAKAETDYADEPFPSSACILDMNRCALIFQDIKSMLTALDLFKQKISYFQSGNIVAICREKNGFAVYKHEKPDYADIKLNVLIKGIKYNVIGEVQFMLRAMMNFKHSVQSLYSIIRRKEFVDDFIKVLPYKSSPQIELMRAASMVDYNALCDLIVTHGFNSKQLMMPINPEDGSTIIVPIFKNLHIKEKEKAAIRCFKLLLNNVDKELIEATLFEEDGSIGEGGGRALGHYEMTKLLFSEFPSFEQKIKGDDDLLAICSSMLMFYPEPQQFKNLIDLLQIQNDTVIEWAKRAEMISMPLMSRQEDNVKFVLSLLPNKTARMKLLNLEFKLLDQDEFIFDEDMTVLTMSLMLGAPIKTLLMAFNVEERVNLIEIGNLIFLSVAMQKIDTTKMIIESIDGAPKDQLKYLTQTFDGLTFSEYAAGLGAESFSNWITNKIEKLQSQQT